MSTLGELKTRARRKVDAVGNNFFTDEEVGDYINNGLAELYDIIIMKYEDYFVSSISFSLVSGQSTYEFSSLGLGDFYKLLGVDAVQGTDTVRVKRCQFSDRNVYKNDEGRYNHRGYANYEYAIRGNSIEFLPDPESTDTIKVFYIPQFTKLTKDSDLVDNRIMINWEEYAAIIAAMKMRHKEETSTTALERDLDRVRALIEEAAGNRDAAEPMGITDEFSGVLPHHRWGF
tara:strand:+ start:532 stop:1224 length:693 start_codon:yes stop_codon:yes gene_type:complete